MMKLPFVAFTAILLLFWSVVPGLLSVPEYVFPSAGVVFEEGLRIGPLLLKNLKATAIASIGGCLLGGSIGFLIGATMALSKIVKNSILPYVVGSNAIPIVAVAPLVTMWFGHGYIAKIVVAAFLSFFPLAINAYRGLSELDVDRKDLLTIIGATDLQVFFKYRLPNALPYILTGLKLSATFAVIGAVVAEFIGADRGLGFGMLQASYSLNTPRLFVYLLTACLLGISMYAVVSLFEVYVSTKRNGVSGRLGSAGR